jgi:hypothetical protein
VTSSGSPEQGAARAGSPRRTFAMTIVAQDPSVGNAQGMLRATVPVPADRIEPGPRGAPAFGDAPFTVVSSG